MLLYSCACVGGVNACGWTFTPQRGDGKMTCIASEDRHEDRGGKWESPVFAAAANEFACYRMKFTCKSTVNAYYAVFFHDAQGKPIAADVYGHIYGGEGWSANDVCFYGRERGRSITIAFQSTARLEIRLR